MKKYQIIYADPPWQQRKGGLRKVRPNQNRQLGYTLMTIQEIEKILDMLEKITTQQHILFLWTIDKHLHTAQHICNCRGYTLHARIIWDKENGIAPAFTIRFAHEYLLWFYKGHFLPIAKEFRGKYTSVLREKSTQHSRKPQIAYKFIEDLYPNTNKLELFARPQSPLFPKRQGWDVWGNEVEGDIEL